MVGNDPVRTRLAFRLYAGIRGRFADEPVLKKFGKTKVRTGCWTGFEGQIVIIRLRILYLANILLHIHESNKNLSQGIFSKYSGCYRF